MPVPAIGALLTGVGRVAGGAAMRGIAGAGIRRAVDGIANTIRGDAGSAVRNIFSGRGNQTIPNIEPATSYNVVEGFATAVKGAGGGGGAIVPTGGSSLVSRKTSAIVKAGGGNSIIEQLQAIRSRLDQLVEIELAAKKSLEDQILKYVRDSEKDARTKEQNQQESSSKAKSDVEKNPVVKAAKKTFGGIFDFIKDLVVKFIQYKVLDWLSKPENKDKIKNTIQFFMNLFKVLKTLYDIILGPQLKLVGMMTSLLSGGINTFFEFIGGVVNFFSLKWLPGFDGIIETIKNIPKIFTEMIPNAINGIINFFTKSLFGAVEEEGDRAINSAVGSADVGKAPPSDTGGTQPDEQQQPNLLGGAIQGIGNALGTILNPVGAITGMIGGLFGGNKDKQNPQLRDGGIVSNKKSDVSVKPLDELSSVAGVTSALKKSIKMFMELLTMPIRLVGAAMIALIMHTVGKIPGVKPFLQPIVDNIVSMFNLPPSIASIVSGRSAEPPVKKKEKKKKQESKTQQNTSPSPPPPPTLPPPDQSEATAAPATTTTGGSQPGAAMGTTGSPMQQWAKNFPDLAKKVEFGQSGFNQIQNVTKPNLFGDVSKNSFGMNQNILGDEKGGWIDGPQSGYPVSLDGGLTTAFIGHGTEWLGFKKSEGGKASSAYVVPFNTPATRSNGGLTQRRYTEAARGGYHLPYSMGGKVETKRGSGDEGLKTKTSGGSVITSRYGMRWGRWHAGTDLAGVPIGTPIKTLTGGKVLYASSYSGYGNTVDLQVSPGKVFRFAHLDGFAVKTGQVVPAGSLIGTLGNTGVGTGPHLHFEHRTKQDFGKGSSMDPEQTGALSEISIGGKPISGVKPDDTSAALDQTMQSPDQETQKKEEPFIFGTEHLKEVRDLYKLLNPESEPSSSKLQDVQTENLVTSSMPSTMTSSVGTTIIDASSQSTMNTSVSTRENPLGNTLPTSGTWSIYKINL